MTWVRETVLRASCREVRRRGGGTWRLPLALGGVVGDLCSGELAGPVGLPLGMGVAPPGLWTTVLTTIIILPYACDNARKYWSVKGFGDSHGMDEAACQMHASLAGPLTG